MANESKQLYDVKIPDDLVQKLEHLPGGMQPTLAKIEKEYGISVSSSSSKHFSITGPSPEILDVAIETLEKQLEAQERQDNKESVTNSPLEDKRSAWKFFGEYARKATHLFLPELKELQRVESVIVQEKKNCLEITCSYDDTNAVKVAVNHLENALHDLHEDEVKITANDKDINKIYKFIQNTQKHDKTVLIVLNEETTTAKISGKTEHHVQKVADKLRSGKVTDPLVLPVLVKSKKFENHLKLPPVIVKKIEKQKGGIFPIITATEKEFGLEIKYVRDKHFIIFGPNADFLELMAQTLVLRYVMKTPLEHGIIGILQRQNAVWKFLGEYAKKVNHLFKRELAFIDRIKTVTIRAFPCQINPTCVEILCSVKVVQQVKAGVEQLVDTLNKLFGHHVRIPDTDRDKQNARDFVRFRHEHDTTVLCIFEEESRTLAIFGRNLYIVRQVANEVQALVTSVPQIVPVPDKIKNTYRQMYQTRLNDAVVERLQKRSGGIVPIIQRLEKEYGLKAIHNKNKVALVSPSEEVLELATETMEARYAADLNRHGPFKIMRGKPRCLQIPSKIEKC